MNRKGFTLIEVLAVVIIIGLLGVLIVPGLLNNINTAKEKSYNTLISNIVTGAQTYYEECEYGDLSNRNKYGDYACTINTSEKTITITLGTLANTGLLKTSDTTIENNKEIKIVKDPKTDKEISDCKIQIKKQVNMTTYKVTYQITNIDTNNICPTEYK